MERPYLHNFGAAVGLFWHPADCFSYVLLQQAISFRGHRSRTNGRDIHAGTNRELQSRLWVSLCTLTIVLNRGELSLPNLSDMKDSDRLDGEV